MMKSGKIEFQLQGPIARIWLNDPQTLNAIAEDMVEDIQVCLAEAESKARVVVLSGRGGHFCSGANLAPGSLVSDPTADLDAGLTLETHFNPMMTRLRDLTIPWLSSVSGAAAGVGCALALAGDLVVASRTAYFLMAFRRIGLVPDGGSAFLLSRSAGRVRAMEMMLLGEKLPAQTALEWGMINRVCEADNVEATVMEIATRLATGPTRALALTRRLAWLASESDFPTCLEFERRFQAEAGRTTDFAEGVAAFREKRPARFTGS